MLACLLWSPAPAGADAATYQNLLERGFQSLVAAERARNRGDIVQSQREARRAEARFLEATKVADANPIAHRLGCAAAAFAGDANGAWAWYQRYRARTAYGARDPDLPYLKALIYLYAAGKPGPAVQSLIQMRAWNARHRPQERDKLLYAAHIHHGASQVAVEAYAGAIKSYREAARLAGHRGWARKELAAIGLVGIGLRIASRWIEAAETFDTLIRRNPENVLWYWNKGLTIASQHDFAGAVPLYRKVIAMREAGQVQPAHKDDVDLVFLRIGNCLRNMAGAETDPKVQAALLDEAEGHIQHYVKLHPKDARGHKWMGELYYPDRDQPHAAMPHFEKAFALDPDCDSSLRAMVQILVRFEPPKGETAAETRALAEAWATKRDAYRKDLEEGRERREEIITERERTSAVHTSGCE